MLPIAAALGYAALHMLTRHIGKTESALTMSFYIQMTFIVICAVFWLVVSDGRFATEEGPALNFLLREWADLKKEDWSVFALLGASSAFGGFLISQAYRKAEAAFVAPFEYVFLIWAVLLGWFIWSETVSLRTIIGILIIVSAGIFILYREKIKEQEIK